MRGRRGLVIGWAVVVGYAALMAWSSLVALDRTSSDRAEVTDATAAARFVDAWQRYREATFVTFGTYERRNQVTGATLSSDDVVAQRPPRRLHRQMGGVEGRDDDRLIVCPAPPAGAEDQRAPCSLAPPRGPTYAEDVAEEVEGVRTITSGSRPLYSVREPAPGCFDLTQLRVDPRAPFGVRSSFCFDPVTGAVTTSRVHHEGGTVEVVVVTSVRPTVADADLVP